MKTKLLLLLLLANFSVIAQTNLVPNGDFENWSSSSQPDNWIIYLNGLTSQSAMAQNGASGTKMTITSGNLNFINSEYFAVQANKTYRITLYHKLVSGTFSAIDLRIYHKPGTFKEEIKKETDATFSTTEWRKVEFEYTSTASENIEVDIWTTGDLNSEILVDNVSVVDVDDVPVQYTLIPDPNFEQKLIDLGHDDVVDGKVLTSQINTLTSLDVLNSNISDLTGIEDFIALSHLEISFNKLTTLDLSKNKALTTLGCSENELIDLNINECTLLTQLLVDSNKLTNLDVSKNTLITRLVVNSNKLQTLDLSKNTALDFLVCNENQLTSLDLSNNYALQIFDGSNNKLTDLYTPNSNNLVALTCENNLLSNLDISNNTALDLLNFSGNRLSYIDLTEHKSLSQLFCSSNQLTSLDVSKNPLLRDLKCSSNQLTKLNLKNGNNTNLHSFNINLENNPTLSCIQVDSKAYSDTNWMGYKDTTAEYNEDCEYYTLIPDQNFEQKLIDLGIDNDGLNGKVKTLNISTLTSLDVSNSGIKSLVGIEDFTALQFLYCASNQLTELHITKNTDLRLLTCYSNKLTNLDTSKNTKLFTLDCQSNQLTILDISKNTALTSLNCSSNQLTLLDISNQNQLKYLDCSSNQLTTLDVSNNTALWSLSCYSNQLTSIDLSANIELEGLNCYSNQLTSLDVENHQLLKYLDCSNNQLTSIDVSKNQALWNFDCSSNLLNYLNIKNGNNTNFNTISFVSNPNLTCILVDDIIYSNTNWAEKKDARAKFNTDCIELTLPTNNFTIQTKGETCLNENNGEITITAKEPHSYTATINGENYLFTDNSLSLSNLTPGDYSIYITISDENFEQFYNVKIPKGGSITAKSSVSSKKVNVEITEGTAPFNVFIDGKEQFQTYDYNFDITLSEDALIEVASAKSCEGIFSKKITGLDFNGNLLAYPNPTSGSFEIEIPTSKSEIKIELYNITGQLLSQETYKIENGKAQLNLSDNAAGLYIAKINLDTPEYLKIIKN